MSIEETIREMAQRAKAAAKVVSVLDTNTKNKALERIAQGLIDEADVIKKENQKDLAEGKEKTFKVTTPRAKPYSSKKEAAAEAKEGDKKEEKKEGGADAGKKTEKKESWRKKRGRKR